MNDSPVLLVTGATGYIGSKLLASPEMHHPFKVFWMSSTRWGQLNGQEQIVEGNFNGMQEVNRIIEVIEPNHVIHLATRFIPHHQPDDLPALLDGNLNFAVAVADAASRVGSSLLFTSSAWQHYQGHKESVSLYAALKEAFSSIVDYYVSAHGLVAREVCLFDTYGSSDNRGKLVTMLLQAARSGEWLRLGDPRKLINLTHIDDVVSQLFWVLNQIPDREWVIRDEEPVTLGQLIEICEVATNTELHVTWNQDRDRTREMFADWKFGKQIPTRRLRKLEDGLRLLWEQGDF